MKKKEKSFYIAWLRPTKLKIIFSILIFSALIFSILGSCMTMKSFDMCLNYLFKDYLVLVGLILISYFSAAEDLELSLITRWNLKNKIYWIIFIPIFILIIYLLFTIFSPIL